MTAAYRFICSMRLIRFVCILLCACASYVVCGLSAVYAFHTYDKQRITRLTHPWLTASFIAIFAQNFVSLWLGCLQHLQWQPTTNCLRNLWKNGTCSVAFAPWVRSAPHAARRSSRAGRPRRPRNRLSTIW